MRVCFLLPAHWTGIIGGAEIQVRYIIDALRTRKDAEIFYICRNSAVSDDEGVRVINARSTMPLAGYMHSIDARRVLRELRRIEPDVIYVRVDSPYLGIAAWYCRSRRCKLIWHISSERDVQPYRLSNRRAVIRYCDRKIFEYGVRRADVIIAQAEYQAELLLRNFGRTCTAVIPNFHRLPSPAEKQTWPKRIVWLGSVKPVKRPEKFVELARRLEGDGRFEFIMAGALQDAAWEKALPRLVADATNLHYMGQLRHEEVSALLASAHLLVSTASMEGFPNVFIEAWLNKAVVVSLEVDPDGVLEKKGLGRRSGTMERLLEDVLHYSEDAEAWAETAERSYRYACEHHSLRNADRVLDHFFC